MLSYTSNSFAAMQLQLARMGIDLGNVVGDMQYFRPVRPGVVAYKEGGLAVLKKTYATEGNLKEVGDTGVYSGTSASGENVTYIPADHITQTHESIQGLVKQQGFNWEVVKKMYGSDGSAEQNAKLEADWKKGWRPDVDKYQAELKAENIKTSRGEFDTYGPEWLTTDPDTGESLFDEETGGYVVIHKGHNLYPHELNMAKAFMKAGYKVKLLNENGPENVPTPDAEIIGESGVFDFKNISEKAQTNNIQKNIHDAILAEGSSNENPVFTIQNNVNATVEIVNKGIDDAIRTADRGRTKLPEKVGLVYADGTVKIITIEGFRNGTRF